MSPLKAYVVLAAFAAAGCARNAEVVDETATAAPAIAAAPGHPAESIAAGAEPAGVIPDAVVDANELIANTPAQPVCRELLRPNSNVRTKQCMSAAAWELYDRAEAQRAGELVRTWQGGRYR